MLYDYMHTDIAASFTEQGNDDGGVWKRAYEQSFCCHKNILTMQKYNKFLNFQYFLLKKRKNCDKMIKIQNKSDDYHQQNWRSQDTERRDICMEWKRGKRGKRGWVVMVIMELDL